MVRAANAAFDSGEIRQEDAQQLLGALEKFDEIFCVLQDDDAVKMRAVLDWAKAQGREKEISSEALDITRSGQLSDDAVNQKLAAMKAARDARDFKLSDSIRAELVAAGIIVENTKDGVRWRRK
jgi:cysteinyl-tRNA synthetase